MAATTVALDSASYERLLKLVARTGRPATVILEQALADYEGKVAPRGAPPPVAAAEAEMLEDTGRIRLPPRAVRSVVGRIVPQGRSSRQPGNDPEE